MSISSRIDQVCCRCSIAKLCLTVCDPMECRMQAPLSSTISQSLLRFMSIESVILSNHLILCTPFSFYLQSFPASQSFPLYWVAKVLQLQHQSFQWIFRTDFLKDGLVWSPCNPRDSQESSPSPQFKSINSLVLSLLYGSVLTSIHDHWKNHIFDYKDLCPQSNFSAF